MMKRSAYLAAASTVLAIGALTYLSAGTSAAPQSVFVFLDGTRTSIAALHGRVALASFVVVNCAEIRKLPFKVAIDNTGTVARRWGEVKLTPTTFVLDKRGEVVAKFTGEPDFAALHLLIEKLLAQS